MRALIIGAVALMASVLAPGAAHAAAPSNDDFDNAAPITALPFSSTVDTRGGSEANDDPYDCSWSTSNVWFRYTAPADGFVRMTADRAEGEKPALSAYTGARGALTWTPGACVQWHGGGSDTFAVAAGTTYHFLLQDTRTTGPVTFNLESVPRAANDDFASAVDVSLGTDATGHAGAATTQPGEPRPTCDNSHGRSLWYRYAPDRAGMVSAKVTAELSGSSVTVFRGTALDALTQVDCVHTSHDPAIFAAVPGETYHLRIADGIYGAHRFTLRLEEAPRIEPTIEWVSPANPGVFDDIQFTIVPGDPAGRWLAGGEVGFGDGTSAAIPAAHGAVAVRHRYAADGAYEITVTGHTADGRSGSTTRTFTVETHDATVSDVVAPATAKVGDTGRIEVSVSSSRYSEDVVVELLRQRWDGYSDVVGTVRQHVAKGGTAVVPFTYAYSEDDAALGKVTLKGRVRLDGREDNNPVDNERRAETKVVAAG